MDRALGTGIISLKPGKSVQVFEEVLLLDYDHGTERVPYKFVLYASAFAHREAHTDSSYKDQSLALTFFLISKGRGHIHYLLRYNNKQGRK